MKFDRNIVGNARKMKMMNRTEAETVTDLIGRKDNKSISIKVYSAIGLMISENLKRGFKKWLRV